VYENDELRVANHNLASRTITHYPVEEVLDVSPVANATAAMKAEKSSEASTSTVNKVYFVDGRVDGKLSLA
jgi:hypothetical protein